MHDPIHDRGKAIEDLFFAQKDQLLLAKMKQEMAASENRQSLSHASGISDVGVLDALLANQISPETLTCVGLIPLVCVAWADNVVHPAEKKAILQSAQQSGVIAGTASYQMLELWLATPPTNDLRAAWKAYIHALKTTLEPADFERLKNSILKRAESVCKAAGGFLGLGNKISDSERAVLDDLKMAFE